MKPSKICIKTSREVVVPSKSLFIGQQLSQVTLDEQDDEDKELSEKEPGLWLPQVGVISSL